MQLCGSLHILWIGTLNNIGAKAIPLSEWKRLRWKLGFGEEENIVKVDFEFNHCKQWVFQIASGKKIVHKINHLSVVFYENSANMKNIAVVEIYLNGNQEFIFLKRVTTTYTSFPSYFVN